MNELTVYEAYATHQLHFPVHGLLLYTHLQLHLLIFSTHSWTEFCSIYSEYLLLILPECYFQVADNDY